MIRITGGEFRGRKIKSPPGYFSRPTIDRVRKALFDILQSSIPGSCFLDLYSGVGLVGIEALSRGAARVIFVEKDERLVFLLKENLSLLGVKEKAVVLKGAVNSFLGQTLNFNPDIIFLDPPYERDEVNKFLEGLGSFNLKHGFLIAAQHSIKEKVLDRIEGLIRVKQEQYGETALSFFRS
jgi:16S rRNA (guanine966-N2)-methyltransferase